MTKTQIFFCFRVDLIHDELTPVSEIFKMTRNQYLNAIDRESIDLPSGRQIIAIRGYDNIEAAHENYEMMKYNEDYA